MTDRFGSETHRQNAQSYIVKPEQNLTKNQLKKVINNGETGANH